MTLSPDVTLRGRYRPTQRVAVGGMGEIWCAEDTLLGRAVAIKMVRPEYADDPTFRDRFRNEARHAAVLTHPNVTQVFDFDEGGHDDAGPPYIVMEFVDGQPLATLLDQQGHLSDEQTWSIVGQTAGALAAAHAIGVVHRDVKPGNIMVCADGWVKVTDFGIARAVDQAGTTQTGFLMGTAAYLAPELCRGEPAAPASDLYGLGVVAYECLTGHAPFTGDMASILQAQLNAEPPPLPDTVSPGLRELVMALLAKDPAARPTDAAEIAAQAQRLTGAINRTRPTGLTAYDPYPTQPTVLGPDTQAFDGIDDGAVTGAVDGAVTGEAAPPAAAALEGLQPAATPRRRPPLLPLLAGLGGLAVLALLVYLVLQVTGHKDSAGSAGPTGSSSPKASASAAPIHIANAAVFSPGGGGDHPEELPLAIDGSTSSAWFTEHYATADFGNLKPGAGVAVQLRSASAASAVRAVTVRFAEPGLSVKLYAGSSAATLLQQKVQATEASAPKVWRVQLDQPVKAKYWLVWITKLAPDGGAYRAGIADLHFTG